MDKWEKQRQLTIKSRLIRLLIMAFLLLPALSIADELKDTVQATIIHFAEYEQGSGNYPVSMAVTPEYLRIDDTAEGKDFVLLNRSEKVIYSVNSEDQNIIQINLKPVSIPSPIELKLREVELPLAEDAPLIAGKQARHYQYFVNDKLCYEVISVPGLMPDAVAALKTFRQVLAGQQSETLRAIPGDLQEGCDLAQHIFYPTFYLEKGFPILEKASVAMIGDQASNGDISYSRTLNNFKQEKIPAQRFVLPGYRIIPIN